MVEQFNIGRYAECLSSLTLRSKNFFSSELVFWGGVLVHNVPLLAKKLPAIKKWSAWTRRQILEINSGEYSVASFSSILCGLWLVNKTIHIHVLAFLCSAEANFDRRGFSYIQKQRFQSVSHPVNHLHHV